MSKTSEAAIVPMPRVVLHSKISPSPFRVVHRIDIEVVRGARLIRPESVGPTRPPMAQAVGAVLKLHALSLQSLRTHNAPYVLGIDQVSVPNPQSIYSLGWCPAAWVSRSTSPTTCCSRLTDFELLVPSLANESRCAVPTTNFRPPNRI